MDAALSIDQLRDAEVYCVAGEKVGVFAAEFVAVRQEADHLAKGGADGEDRKSTRLNSSHG